MISGHGSDVRKWIAGTGEKKEKRRVFTKSVRILLLSAPTTSVIVVIAVIIIIVVVVNLMIIIIMNGASVVYTTCESEFLAFAKSFDNETVKNSREYQFFLLIIICIFCSVRRTLISLGTAAYRYRCVLINWRSFIWGALTAQRWSAKIKNFSNRMCVARSCWPSYKLCDEDDA